MHINLCSVAYLFDPADRIDKQRCILIFAALLIYSIRRIYWFYLFQDGYAIETMYDGTDIPGPEEIGITNYRTY